MAAAVALAGAVDRVAGVPAMLKWPNDLVVGDRKLAGLLAERDGDALVVGAGCNVNWERFPDDLAGRPPRATSRPAIPSTATSCSSPSSTASPPSSAGAAWSTSTAPGWRRSVGGCGSSPCAATRCSAPRSTSPTTARWSCATTPAPTTPSPPPTSSTSADRAAVGFRRRALVTLTRASRLETAVDVLTPAETRHDWLAG